MARLTDRGQENTAYMNADCIFLAGVLGIEPRSSVLETDVLAAVLYPYMLLSIIPKPPL